MQEQKQSYFVSLEKKAITEVSVPDTVEYEIIASSSEFTILKGLMSRISDYEFANTFNNVIFNPLGEELANDTRNRYSEDLRKIYQFLYDYGTKETKNKLKEVGVKLKAV